MTRGTKWVWRGLLEVLICLVASVSFALAEGDSRAVSTVDNVWRTVFEIENDVLVAEDRHYTNGLFLSVLAPSDYVPEWIATAAHLLPPYNDDPSEVRWGFAIGHRMITPEFFSIEELVVDDRPYAGWLFGRLELYRDRNRDLAGKIPYLDRFEIDFGVVGPAAIAREAQSGIHTVFLTPKFRGWDNQLKNEFGLVLRRGRHWRIPGEAITVVAGLELDVIANLTIDLGNVKTAATAGLMLRAGWRLPKDFGRGRFSPGDAGRRIYVFAGTDVSGVLRDIFLDGNTFRDSHHIGKQPVVIHAPSGIAYASGRFRTSLSVIWNSEEFRGQKGADLYGRWSLGFDY